jgi:hypothetical protein
MARGWVAAVCRLQLAGCSSCLCLASPALCMIICIDHDHLTRPICMQDLPPLFW